MSLIYLTIVNILSILYKIHILNTMDENKITNISTGMIMDAVNNTADIDKKTEAMQAAIDNDQIKNLKLMAQRYAEAHTTKVREFPRIGRNDLCLCGSGKKYKNCCLKSGKYENYVKKNNR